MLPLEMELEEIFLSTLYESFTIKMYSYATSIIRYIFENE